VFALARSLEEPRTLNSWRELMRSLLADFWVAEDAWEPEIRRVVRMIDDLGALEASAGFSRPVSAEVVRSFLKERLEGDRLGRGFLAGGVTFCAMLPMRTIPFKVVCLIGMNDDAFPRDHRPLAFDLISRHPRPGDRSRRSDDKYLFLEALLSARKALYISYVGRSIQDNAPLPPSVLVSELADELQAGLRPAAGGDGGGLVTEHRLQSFAKAYFQDGSGLFSYSREDFLAWAAPGRQVRPLPFFRHPLAMAEEDAAVWRNVPLEGLAAFLSHPSRFLLQKRVGIRLEEDSGALEESEPFELDPLTRYRIGSTLLEDCLAGRDPMSLLPAFRAAGELPHGRVGEHLFSRLAAEVRGFTARAKGLLPQMGAAPFEGLFEIGGFRLAGRVTGRSASGVVRIRYADISAADVIRAWLNHLFLEAGRANAAGARSLLIGRNAAYELRPVADGRRLLADLLDLYWSGLAAPIPFFPAAALAYARKLLAAGGSRTLALASAQRRWTGSEPIAGEAADPYHRLCHGQGESLGADFERLAVRVFQPFFHHAEPILF
jgi:exodeoxyribonuclease V gamma subunit